MPTVQEHWLPPKTPDPVRFAVLSRFFPRWWHFVEASLDQLGQGFDGGFSTFATGSQSQCRTVSCPERQQVEDAFAVDRLVSLENLDVAGERFGQLHEQVRRPGMKSLRIDHRHRACRNEVQGSVGV